MSVDPTLREWLTSEALWTSGVALAEPWAATALTADMLSPFATKAGGDAEAARRRSMRAKPIAADRHSVPGKRADLIGRLVTLTGTQLGYDAGVKSLVIGAREMEGGTTELLVLRRLG